MSVSCMVWQLAAVYCPVMTVMRRLDNTLTLKLYELQV